MRALRARGGSDRHEVYAVCALDGQGNMDSDVIDAGWNQPETTMTHTPGPISDRESETALEGRTSFLAPLSLCSFESEALSSSSIVTAMSLGYTSPEYWNKSDQTSPTFSILISWGRVHGSQVNAGLANQIYL